MIQNEIIWTENLDLTINIDQLSPSFEAKRSPNSSPVKSSSISQKLTSRSYNSQNYIKGSGLEENYEKEQHQIRSSSTASTSKFVPQSRDPSQQNQQEEKDGKQTPWLSNDLDTTKYFGYNARTEFYQRHKWMSEHKNLFPNDVDDMKDRIRFDHKKNSITEYPFAPKRPESPNNSGNMISGESSSISGLFSDLSYASSIPILESVSTFDPSYVKNDPGCPTSPRSKFLTGCMKNKVNPPASLILRKKMSRSLNLQHYGFGDQYGTVYAEALANMPLIDTINIEDNHLTDKGLYPIIHAIISLSTVTDLNLSNNIVDGESAKALSEYLSSPHCCIQRLILQKADIDDDEGTAFISALNNNTTLTELDMSHNLLGKSENMNTVFPDLITGGEALADLLTSNTCALTTLRLPWNMIRLDGAIALSSSLRMNTHIVHLDISYNSLGESGGEALGSALLTNQTLRTLLVQNNNLTSSACFSICVGIEENFSLREVNLDGNPIGELGAQVLTQLPIVCGERVQVSAARCNLSMKYPKDTLFNMESPSSVYVLHLDDYFERAVCLKLLRLVAAHPTFEFNEVVYYPPISVATTKTRPSSAPAGKSKARSPAPKIIHLRQGISQYLESLDDTKLGLIEKLKQLQQAARNNDEIVRLFNSFDTDQSGSLDIRELKKLLHSIGLDIPNDVLENAIERFDVDGIGTLEMPEFMDFLKSQDDEATARIKEITELPVMIDSTTGRRYIPPLEGTIRMSVGDTYTNKKSQKIISALDHQYIMDLVSRGTESVAKVLIYSIQNSRVRLREALCIFRAINEEVYDKAEIAMKILPRIADPADARQFLLQAFRYDKLLWKRLETMMGSALKVCIGLFNGFYYLDLSQQFDRVCLAKLLEQSQAKRIKRGAKSLFGVGMTGDVSQWGDWSSFRNAYIDGVQTVIVPEMFNPMPTRGKIHFDFSGGSKYIYGESITNDSRCVNMLLNLQLIASEDVTEVHQHLKELREQTRRDLPGDGHFEPFIDRLKAEAIQLSMLKFYHMLPTRPIQYDRSQKILVGTEDIVPLENEEEESLFVHEMTSDGYESVVFRALGPVGYSILKMNPKASEKDLDLEAIRTNQTPLTPITESAEPNRRTFPVKMIEENELIRKSGDMLDSSSSQRETIKKTNPLLNQRKNSPKNDGEGKSDAGDTQSQVGLVTPSIVSKSTTNRLGFFSESEEKPRLDKLSNTPLVTNRRGVATAKLPVVLNLSSSSESNAPSVNTTARSISRSMSIQGMDASTPPISLRETLIKAKSSSNLRVQTAPTNFLPNFQKITPTAESQPSHLKKLESLASFDEEPDPVNRRFSTAQLFGPNPKVLLPQNTEEYMQGYGRGVANVASQAARATKIIDALCDVLSRVWILSRHLALICLYFEDGLAPCTLHFGTYRVELIINLYSRIADVHNFDVVLKVLSPFEIGCIYCRLGILNVFNPLKPEGYITLNLARHEERVIAKILAVLSVYEPGDNWLDKSFRWGYDKEEIPGWELTKTWLTEEGMLQKGFLVVNYYSGDGKFLKGCCPNVPFRKSLLHLVSLEEADFIHDMNNKLALVNNDATQIHSVIEGDKVAKSYIDLWMQLLSPVESSSVLIAQGKSVMKVFQQLKINPGYRDVVRDIFNPKKIVKRKTVRQSIKGKKINQTTSTPKSKGKK